MKYLRFALLCWKAYNGDIKSGLEAARILREKLDEAVAKVKASK